MIDFKKVCENFNIVFNNKRQLTRDFFLNASLEIIKDSSQEASFEEIIYALQQRQWADSTESPKEVEKNIKRIWIQTKFIYPESFNTITRNMQDIYQKSILEGTFFDSFKIDEYSSTIREECESLSIAKCVSSIKKYLSQPNKEHIQLILEDFNKQIEKRYRQAVALQGKGEFYILNDWKENHKDKFFSVFIEEHNGKIEKSFPELLKIYDATKTLSIKNKKSRHFTYSYTKINKKIREQVSPKDLRERLLKIVQTLSPIEMSFSDKIKFILRKNSMHISVSDFRDYSKLIKFYAESFDDLGVLKRLFQETEKKYISAISKNKDGLFLKSQIVELERNFQKVKIVVINDIFLKKSALKSMFFTNSTRIEFGLTKLQESDLFDRELERLLIQAHVKEFAQSEMNLQNSKVTYNTLLQELDKIRCKQPAEKQQAIYTISERTQDFFRLLGKEVTQLYTLEEYKDLDIPVLQSIFTREETEEIRETLEKIQLDEDAHYQNLIEAMLQSKLELQSEKRECTTSSSKTKGKTRNDTLDQEKKCIDQKSRLLSIPQSWREIIPLKIQSTIKLLYPIHVTRWFENPKNALQDPKYTSIIKQFGKETCLYFHRFPKVIDELVGTEYSLQNEVDNKRTGQRDHLYGIPGEIKIKGKRYRGFFQYIIDAKSRVCYHRCFNHRSKNFIEDIIEEKVWYPNDFPTLDQSKDYEKQKMETFIFKEAALHYDSLLQRIHVATEEMNVVIFKSFDSDLIDEFFEFMDKINK